MGLASRMFSHLLLGLLIFLVERNYCASVEKEDGWTTQNEKMNDMASAIEELSERMEKMEAGWIAEKFQLESLLENKNQEVEKLQSVVETMKSQWENKKEELANVKRQMESMDNRMGTQVAKLEKQVDDAKRTTGSDSGEKLDRLKELPYLMVCAFQNDWRSPDSVVPYDRITTEYNNANQPGGGDGSMDIKTGVFTVITSGYYVITYSASARVRPGEATDMYINRNGELIEESRWLTMMASDGSAAYIDDQGSRTVFLHLVAGDTIDLRTVSISYRNAHITLCISLLPVPYA